MKQKLYRRIAAAAVGAAIVTVGVGGIATAVTVGDGTGDAETRACVLQAIKPSKDGSNAVAVGKRTGCDNTVSWVRVELKHKMPLPPDTVVAQNTYQNVKELTSGRAQTTGRGGAVYYTKVISSTGASTESSDLVW